MHKPLISKIRCLSPNQRAAAIRNYNHLYYIATREGVDLQPLEQELSTFKNDMSKSAENDAYMKYISERPRSNGLFGNIDTNDVNAACTHMKKISKNKCVFRGIVSLCQVDAEELNFTNKESWAKFLQETLPDVGEKLGISGNDLSWVAAYHNEHGHPHVHYMLWSEAKEQHINPFISVPQQHQCRELLSKKMFEQERELYTSLKTNFRDILTDGTKEFMPKEILNLKQEVLGLPEYRSLYRINKQLLQESTKELLELVEMLPQQGRIKSYKYMPPDVKEKIQSVTKLLLGKYELQDEYQKFLKAHEQLTLAYTPTKKEKEIGMRKAKDDIDNRLGNIILSAVRELRQNKDLYFSVIDSKSDAGFSEQSAEIETDSDIFSPEPDPSSDPSPDLSSAADFEFQKPLIRTSAVYIKWDKGYKAATSELCSKTPDFDKAIKLLNAEHQKGNVLATYELGEIYERNLANANPELAETYYQEALRGFCALFDGEHSFYSAYRLGKMYEYGQGTEKNIESAKAWYEKAEDNVYAQYSLAEILMSEAKANDDFSSNVHIIDLLESSSVKNNYASYELGRIYHDGLFAKQDSAASQTYYKQAFNGFSQVLVKSETNDDLLYRLGKMHQLGLGTTIDVKKATKLFEKAAVLKNTNALYSLSKIYVQSNDEKLLKKAIKMLEELHELTPENHLVTYALGSAYSDPQSKYYDIHKAVKYLEHSGNLDNDFAMLKLGNIYSDSTEKYPELPANLSLAISYLDKSARLGNHLAMYSLGKLFSDTDSDHYNIHKAINFLERSAGLGNDFAMLKLGNIYSDSTDKYPELPANVPLAISYLEKSADMGNNQAMYFLGKLFSDPDSSHFDIHKSIDFLERSADLGNDFAMLKLGNLCLWGKGVPQDKEKGIYWLDKSAAAGNEYAEQSKQAYETYEEEKAMQQAFSLFGSLLRSLCYSNNQARTCSLYTDKGIKGNKKALRENARKNPHKHSHDYNSEA